MQCDPNRRVRIRVVQPASMRQNMHVCKWSTGLSRVLDRIGDVCKGCLFENDKSIVHRTVHITPWPNGLNQSALMLIKRGVRPCNEQDPRIVGPSHALGRYRPDMSRYT